MNETGQQGGTDRGPEPLFVGISEGVNAGYHALEYVLEGLRESLRQRRRSGVAAAPSGAGEPEHHDHAHGGTLDIEQLVSMFAELLESAGDVVQEVAAFIGDIGDKSRGTGESPAKPTGAIVLEGAPGAAAAGMFHIDNPTESATKKVELVATQLLGKDHTIPAKNVLVKSPVERIGPGKSVEQPLAVTVPADTPPGTYHGLIITRPGGDPVRIQVHVKPGQAEDEKSE